MSQGNNLPAITAGMSVDEYYALMAQREAAEGPKQKAPDTVKIDGNSGKYVTMAWDEDQKKSLPTPFMGGVDSWEATVLEVRYFAKWKHEKTKKGIVIRTSEFQLGKNHPVELLQVDYTGDKPKTTVLATYDSYQEFKKAREITDPTSGVTDSPFDFYCSLYAINWADGAKIVNIRLRGTSRGNWMDYMPSAKVCKDGQKAGSMREVITKLGGIECEMPASVTDPNGRKTYWAATFETQRPIDRATEGKTALEMHMLLLEWLASQEKFRADMRGDEGQEAVEVREEPLGLASTYPFPEIVTRFFEKLDVPGITSWELAAEPFKVMVGIDIEGLTPVQVKGKLELLVEQRRAAGLLPKPKSEPMPKALAGGQAAKYPGETDIDLESIPF